MCERKGFDLPADADAAAAPRGLRGVTTPGLAVHLLPAQTSTGGLGEGGVFRQCSVAHSPGGSSGVSPPRRADHEVLKQVHGPRWQPLARLKRQINGDP